MKEERFDRLLYKGKPVRIIAVSDHDAMLQNNDGEYLTVELAELETIDRRNAETR